MDLLYDITDAEGKEIITITGRELRKNFGVGPFSSIFNEQLVIKFNLFRERAGEPERMHQRIIDMEL